jgi:GT2 family glycosyltransferase
MKGIRVAVLIASHNRRDKTLACLRALFHQTFIDPLFADIDVKVFLLDDCSTDGTAEAIQVEYPSVILVHGNGYLFWNKGMRRIWEQALESSYDYYLWLNDDTLLIPEALSCLLTTHQKLIALGHADSIIVGSTQDAKTKAFTYGGIIRSYPWHPLKFSPVPPGDIPIECETMNGNCVLISQSVALKVGNLDPRFSHSLGDFDYGLRARQSRCSVWIAPGFLGTCSLNSTQGTVFKKQKSQKDCQPRNGLSLLAVMLDHFGMFIGYLPTFVYS